MLFYFAYQKSLDREVYNLQTAIGLDLTANQGLNLRADMEAEEESRRIETVSDREGYSR